MELTSRLVRPFAKRYRKYSGKVSAFAGPVWKATLDLLGKLPNPKAFAGSEDLGDTSDGETAEGAVVAGKAGLLTRLKNFKKSLKEMSDFQKLILLTVAVVLPAGILISTLLVGFIKKRRNK